MHVIRLHGPWDYEPLFQAVPGSGGEATTRFHDLPPPGRVTAPTDWGASLGVAFRGRVRYARRFHRPTGLEDGRRVFLAIQGVDAFGLAFLNDHRLGEVALEGGPFRFDVTGRLTPANLLTIEVELLPDADDDPLRVRCGRKGRPGGLIGSVRLEIEEAPR